MDKCICTKEKEIATMQIEIRTLYKLVESNKKEINDMSKIYDLIYGITTNVSVLAEQMTRNTEELGTVRKDVEDIKKKPHDYEFYKRQSENYEHYKKVAIGVLITSILAAFMAGKLFF